MKRDNPIEEIWRIRDELGAAEGYDVHRLFERLRREEKKYGAGSCIMCRAAHRRNPRRPARRTAQGRLMAGGTPPPRL